MRRFDDELGHHHFRPGFSRGINKTLPSILEKSGDAIDAASDILEGVKQKLSNKVVKT